MHEVTIFSLKETDENKELAAYLNRDAYKKMGLAGQAQLLGIINTYAIEMTILHLEEIKKGYERGES